MEEAFPARPNQRRIEEVSYIIIDCETVTPKGFPPEPIELGAMRVAPGLSIDPLFVVSRLIHPPAQAPLSTFDTRQTGIQEADLLGQPTAQAVLAEFEASIPEGNHVLVAHHARYEAAIIERYGEFCPRIASMPFLDTFALGNALAKGLPNYQLDTVAHYFALPIPANRHRALPDVELTAKVLLRLLASRAEAHLLTLDDLLRVAGLKRRTKLHAQMVQLGLFET